MPKRSLTPFFLLWIAVDLSAQVVDTSAQYEMLQTSVRIVDRDGNPIEGALVSCTGLRVKQEPGSHFFPPTDIEWPKLKTDAHGLVTFPYPKRIRADRDVSEITWTVEHPEFVTFNDDRPLDVQPVDIALAAGYKIAVSAIDAHSREAIKRNLYGMVADGSGSWKLFENGMLVSPTLSRDHHWFRLVQIIDSRAVAFSDLLEAQPEDKSRVIFKDVEMKSAVTVRGKLSDNVPRPCNNGRVSLVIFDKSSEDAGQLRWYWFDQTEIKPDGSFEFIGVPRNNVVQVIAICDNWVPRQPPQALIDALFPKDQPLQDQLSYPMPFVVQDEDVEVELAMDPGKVIRVKAVDELGLPVKDVSLQVSPNQYFFNAGTQILGEGTCYAKSLVESTGQLRTGDAYLRFRSTTDESGVASIRSVPADYNSGLYVSSETHQLVDYDDNRIDRRMDEGEITEITIRMQKIEKK